MNQEEFVFRSNEKEEDSLSLLEIVEKYLRHWRWILICVVLSLVAAWLYARYTSPRYESVATVLIEQDNPNTMSEELGMLKDLGLTSSGGNLEDEIELYKSRSLMQRVVSELNLNWKYENLGTKTGFVRSELYDNNPLRIRTVSPDSLFFEKVYTFSVLIVSANKYKVINGDGLNGKSFRFGAVVNSPAGKIILEKSPVFKLNWIGKSIRVSLNPVDQVVTDLQGKLTIQPASKEANLLALHLEGHNVAKNNAILNKIIALHQENAIVAKNIVVQNTTSFINERMKFITAELSDVEQEGASFKTRHHLVDVTTDAAAYLGKEGDLEKKVVETSIEMNLAEFMNEVIQEQNGYEQLLPANLGFKDPSVTEMTNQYNALVLERNRLRETSGSKHPGVSRLESQLASLRTSLEGSLRNMKNSSQMQLRKLKSEEAMYQSKISAIPQFEKEYRDIIRQQQIQESLYLFLLQKREQNEISLAATVANSRVIDEAYSTGIPISPRKKVLYIIALFIGVLIPVIVIYVRNLLNNKVKSRSDLDGTGLTVLGDLPETKNEAELMVLDYPHSGLAESFRVLRTNLSFVLPKDGNACKTIGITSSLSGEGKSITSINLSFIFAASGKKVLLVGLDLRKPRIVDMLQTGKKPGISNYLVNNDLKPEDVISQSISNGQTIDVITSGDIPPNPSELLMNLRLDELIAEMRLRYDYIIFDNAPVGLVVDALTVNRFTDLNLYLIRSNCVDKRYLRAISELHRQKKLNGMYIAVNAVKKENTSYTYGYGEGFEKKSWWKRILFLR